MSGPQLVKGRRYLLQIRDNYYSSYYGVNEFTVLEISPTWKHVKLQNQAGAVFWHAYDPDLIRIVEELSPQRARIFVR